MCRLLRSFVCTLLACCLVGCTAAGKEEVAEKIIEEERISLELFVAENAAAELEEMAKEFVRRAEYFSDGALSIELHHSSNLQELMKQGKADLCIVENSRLTQSLPALHTLELPYLFRNGDYMIGALNSLRSIDQLNHILQERYPMEVEYTALIGYADMIALASLDLSDFHRQNRLACQEEFFTAKLQKELNILHVPAATEEDSIATLQHDKADFAQVQLAKLLPLLRSGENNFLLLPSAHKIDSAFLLCNQMKKTTLSPKQQAAIEQASVLSAGYCRSLVEAKRKEDLLKLENAGIEIAWEKINTEKYFALLGEVYQYRKEEIKQEFDPQLERILRSDAPGISLS